MFSKRLVAILGLALGATAAGGQATIVVNHGHFGSAREAAHAEAKVHWLDADVLQPPNQL